MLRFSRFPGYTGTMRRQSTLKMPTGLEAERITAPRDVLAKTHCHQRHELLVILRGNYRAAVGDKRYAVAVGEAILYPGGCAHTPTFAPMESGEMLRFAWTDPDPGISAPHKFADAGGQLAFLVQWTVDAVDDRTGAANLCLRANAVLECLRERLQPPRDRMERLLVYMRSRLATGVTVRKLATAAGISRSQLFRLFRAELGATPSEVLLRERLAKARALLTQTDLTVKQVAAAVGYSSAQALAHAFHAHLGMSPSACRSARRVGR
jgi:AraC-like DNA-binding protein